MVQGCDRPKDLDVAWIWNSYSENGAFWCQVGWIGSSMVFDYGHRGYFIWRRTEALIEVFGVPSDSLQHLLLNQVIPDILATDGAVVIHAAAVEIDECAAMFLGKAGAGKSTLTAAFVASGYRWLTDDVLRLDWDDQRNLVACPGYPTIRLANDSLPVLANHSPERRKVADYSTKTGLRLQEHFSSTIARLPVRAGFLLEPKDEPCPVRIAPAAPSAIVLVEQAFRAHLSEKSALTEEFKRLMDLASELELYRLEYPKQYDALPEVVSTVCSFLRD
ncbi:MAG: hypothetical protein ACI9R3_005050 [Verrucomicrobiales bacterium]